VVAIPTVTTPKFPDFVRPSVPPSFANSPAAAGEERGWAFLQAGDLKSAEREFAGVLKVTPSFYPAEASLGYVELARQDPKAALPRFDRALEGRRNDVGSLIGRGQTLLALDRNADALSAFEAAVAADPSLIELARRVEVMRFRGAEQTVERARQAARDGRLDDALQAYRTAITNSPDSPFLYREFAAVELRKGQTDEALTSFRKAVSLDPSDATSQAQIGEILDSRNDFEGAERAYTTALANGAPAAVKTRLEGLRARAALARLPAEYRAIDQAAQITRADLAALIGIRLAPLLESVRRSDAALMTDVRTHWAAPWIFAVAARRRHGAVRQPRLPAAIDRSPNRPRAGRGAAAPAGGDQDPGAGAHVGDGAAALHRSADLTPGLPGGFGGGRIRRHENRGENASSRRGRSRAPRRSRRSAARGPCRAPMTALTPANQLTLLRMFLIPGS
jgi:tetratricopeptide (TPR) repeat protein